MGGEREGCAGRGALPRGVGRPGGWLGVHRRVTAVADRSSVERILTCQDPPYETCDKQQTHGTTRQQPAYDILDEGRIEAGSGVWLWGVRRGWRRGTRQRRTYVLSSGCRRRGSGPLQSWGIGAKSPRFDNTGVSWGRVARGRWGWPNCAIRAQLDGAPDDAEVVRSVPASLEDVRDSPAGPDPQAVTRQL